MKNLSLILPHLILLCALIIFPACGRKADLIIPGTVLPKPVTGLSVKLKSAAAILSWTASDKNTRNDPLADLAGFLVLRAEIPEGGTGCPCAFEKVGYIDLEFPKDAVVNGRKVVWADKTGIFGRRYAYRVMPMNKDGFYGEAVQTLPVDFLMPPGKISNLVAEAGNGMALLSWSIPMNDEGGRVMSDLAGYNIYRHEQGVRAKTRINGQPVKENKYTDTGLVNRKTYCYSVTALRGKEPPLTEGDNSEEVCATPANTQAPPPPADLRAVGGEGMVLLSWEPSFEPDVVGYNLCRKAEGESAFKKLNTALISKITYTDKDVKPGVKYTYYVTAVDNAVPPNESKPSKTAEATAQAPVNVK
ncbi:MAG: fibronectin type III domain-containing protein [Nitrospirota bacterium]